MTYFIIAIVWFFGAFFISDLGQKRQIGEHTSFWISLIFGPIIGILVTGASPLKEVDKQTR